MIRLEKINKYFFKNKKNQIHVINDTSLELPEKGLVTLLGPSGSGKTTLLNVIGGLDNFDSGTLNIDGLKLTKANYKRIEAIRNTEIGYVFQDYKLIDDMTVFENVALSLKMCGIKDKNEITTRVNEILELLDIYRYRNRKSAMLSGGERQRVSIARALVKDPRIVICDEPTGNLDSKKTVEIMNIIKAISKSRLVILVSHESDIAKFYSDQIIEIKDGKIVANYQNEISGELDYEIANKIYLKDIKKHYNFKDKGINVEIYNSDDENVKIRLVIRNNNIYIETDNVDNVELINNKSSFELINEHYKGIDKESIESQEFAIKAIPNKKRTSIYTVLSMLKVGWHNLFKTNRMKKITIACAAFSAALVLYAASVYLGAKTFNEEAYFPIDEAYYKLEFNSKDETYDTYMMLKNRDDIYHVHPLEYSIIFHFPLSAYYQAIFYDEYSEIASMGSKSLISSDDLVYGELTDREDEIVIDLSLYNARLGLKQPVRIVGILEAKDLIGKKISIMHRDVEYTITGIVDKRNSTFYFNNDEMTKISMKGETYYDDFAIYENNKGFINITSGKAPVALNEILLSDTLTSKYEIGSNYESHNTEFKVVGFYDSLDTNTMYVNDESMLRLLLSSRYSLVVAPKDVDAFKEEFKDKYKITSIAESALKEYELEVKEKISSSTLSAALFIVITLVFVILMTRASFLSRIKEVGILRAVGVSKGDIIRMFVGETMVLLGVGGAIGGSVMYYVLSLLAEAEYFDFRIVINPIMAIICLVLLLCFYIIVVLIPVLFVIRKSPAAILSRKDI